MASVRERIGHPRPPFKQRSLIRELGWEQNKKKDSRPQRSILAEAAVQFRHEFCPEFGEFPLDYTHLRVRECARRFCERDLAKEKDRFFDKSPEAVESGLLSLPEDRKEIEDLLAKLFCVQEYNSRYNFYTRQIAAEKSESEEDEEENNNPTPTENYMDDNEDEILYYGKSAVTEPKDYSLRATHRSAGINNTVQDRSAEQQEVSPNSNLSEDCRVSLKRPKTKISHFQKKYNLAGRSKSEANHGSSTSQHDKNFPKTDGRYYKNPAHVVSAWPNGKLTSLDEIRKRGAMSPFFENGATRPVYWKANMMLEMGCGTTDAGTCRPCAVDKQICTYSIDPKDRRGLSYKSGGLLRTQYCARCLIGGYKCEKSDLPSGASHTNVAPQRVSNKEPKYGTQSTGSANIKNGSYTPKAKATLDTARHISRYSLSDFTKLSRLNAQQDFQRDEDSMEALNSQSVSLQNNNRTSGQQHRNYLRPYMEDVASSRDSASAEPVDDSRVEEDKNEKSKNAHTGNETISTPTVTPKAGAKYNSIKENGSTKADQRSSLVSSAQIDAHQEQFNTAHPIIDTPVAILDTSNRALRVDRRSSINPEAEISTSPQTAPQPSNSRRHFSLEEQSSANSEKQPSAMAEHKTHTSHPQNQIDQSLEISINPEVEPPITARSKLQMPFSLCDDVGPDPLESFNLQKVQNMTTSSSNDEIKGQSITAPTLQSSTGLYETKTLSPPPNSHVTRQTSPPSSIHTSPLTSTEMHPRMPSTPAPETHQHSPSLKRSRDHEAATSIESPAPIRRRIEPNPPKINFIVPNSNNQLQFETDHPFPSHLLRTTATVSEFFRLYSSHTGIVVFYIEKLIFTVAFANGERLELRRMDGNEEWLTLKKRLSILYKVQKEKRPDQSSFDVWIQVGETMNAGDIGEEDYLDGL